MRSLKTELVKPSKDSYERAGQILRDGGLVAFPTETVYGLGGNALDPEAARKIYSAKGRPGDNPLIVHIADPRDAENIAYTYDLGGQPIFLKGIECRLADGTIAGSVLKLNVAVRNVLENTTLSVPEVVAAASYNPARAIKAKGKGALKSGYDADIIIADEKFNIKRTIKRGNTIYEA